MSTDAITEILAILRKHKNISAKVTIETTKTGFHLTKISLKEAICQTEKRGIKKKKNPSRLLRDERRRKDYLSRKAGSAHRNTAAAPPSPSTNQCTDPMDSRRIVTAGRRRLGSSGAGNEEKGAVWEPVIESQIPQLDGGGIFEDKIEEMNDCLTDSKDEKLCWLCNELMYFRENETQSDSCDVCQKAHNDLFYCRTRNCNSIKCRLKM